MGVLINLVIALIGFVIAKWLLAFVGIGDPLNFLIAIVVAISIFYGGYRGNWFNR